MMFSYVLALSEDWSCYLLTSPKYADVSLETLPASLDRDFKATVKVAPLRPLARSVPAPFLSGLTPPFEEMLVTL
jgi:hypothetical protein